MRKDTVLLRRLYSEEKLRENLECEIMHVVVEEARDSYRSGLFRSHVHPSSCLSQIESCEIFTMERQYTYT